MDPATVFSIVAASASMAMKCGKLAHNLHGLRERYKHAELAILSLTDECKTIQLAWSQLERWTTANSAEIGNHEQIIDRIHQSLDTGDIIMSALDADVAFAKEGPKTLGLLRRAKVVWSESAIQAHQHRIRGLVGSLTLLLETVKLPLPSTRDEYLSIRGHVFDETEASARSVLPSQLSSTRHSKMSTASEQSAELEYRSFAFENDLFTSWVYKRNYRTTFFKTIKTPKLTNSAASSVRTSIALSRTSSVVTELPHHPPSAPEEARLSNFSRDAEFEHLGVPFHVTVTDNFSPRPSASMTVDDWADRLSASEIREFLEADRLGRSRTPKFVISRKPVGEVKEPPPNKLNEPMNTRLTEDFDEDTMETESVGSATPVASLHEEPQLGQVVCRSIVKKEGHVSTVGMEAGVEANSRPERNVGAAKIDSYGSYQGSDGSDFDMASSVGTFSIHEGAGDTALQIGYDSRKAPIQRVAYAAMEEGVDSFTIYERTIESALNLMAEFVETADGQGVQETGEVIRETLRLQSSEADPDFSHSLKGNLVHRDVLGIGLFNRVIPLGI